MKKIILTLGAIASIGGSASLVACGKKLPPILNLGSLNEYLSEKNLEKPNSDLVYWSENWYDDRIFLVYRNGKYGQISYDAKQGWYGFKYDLPKTEFPEYSSNEDFSSLPFTRKIWRDIAPKAELYISRTPGNNNYGHNNINILEAKANYDFDSLKKMETEIREKISTINTKPIFLDLDSKTLSIIKSMNNIKFVQKAIGDKTITNLAKKIANNEIDWFKTKPIKEPKINIRSFSTFSYPDIDLRFTLDLSKKEFIDDLKVSKDQISLAYAGYLIKKYSETLRTYFLPDSLPFDFTIYLPNNKTLDYKLYYLSDRDWGLVIKAKRVSPVSILTEEVGDYYVF